MLSNHELQSIQSIIFNANSSNEARKAAELQLERFCEQPDAWKIHINLLQTADTNNIFLLCIGLNKILWKSWSLLTIDEIKYISESLIILLVNKFETLPTYSRSKIEQLLSTICKNTISYDVLFQLIQYCDNLSKSSNTNSTSTYTNRLIGISASRTILDDALGPDSRLSPDKRTMLTNIASTQLVSYLINTSCQACIDIINIQSTNTTHIHTPIETDTLETSIQLIKVIISKVPLGQHIDENTLNLLFAVAELSATTTNNNTHTYIQYKQASLFAIETLTEFMSKRYLPANGAGTTAGSGNNGTGLPSNSNREYMTGILLGLVAKAVNLIKVYWYVYCVVYCLYRLLYSMSIYHLGHVLHTLCSLY